MANAPPPGFDTNAILRSIVRGATKGGRVRAPSSFVEAVLGF
jgi:hypothetical protein